MAMMRREGSGGPPGGLGGVGRPFRRAKKGPETLLKGWKWSGGYSGGLEGVGRSSGRDSRGRKVFPEGWECRAGAGNPSGGSGGVGRPFQRARGIWEGQQMSGDPPKDGRERLRSPLGGLGRVRRPSRRVGKHLEAHLEGQQESGVVGRPTWKAE